jgi:hypothetical protein
VTCESLNPWTYAKKYYQDGLPESHCASKEQPVRKGIGAGVRELITLYPVGQVVRDHSWL